MQNHTYTNLDPNVNKHNIDNVYNCIKDRAIWLCTTAIHKQHRTVAI